MPSYRGTDRRTLIKIQSHPSPKELLQSLENSEGWKYKTKLDYYRKRDRALIALTYIGALRISETLRITKSMFQLEKIPYEIKGIPLSKSVVKGKPRNVLYRLVRLPMSGEREELTEMILSYYRICETERLFPFCTHRAWKIITATIPEVTCHWLRAFGETYLYQNWDHDLLAVSDYVKVDGRTLQLYIRGQYEKYKVV